MVHTYIQDQEPRGRERNQETFQYALVRLGALSCFLMLFFSKLIFIHLSMHSTGIQRHGVKIDLKLKASK